MSGGDQRAMIECNYEVLWVKRRERAKGEDRSNAIK
jgi:hypothetical protein